MQQKIIEFVHIYVLNSVTKYNSHSSLTSLSTDWF